jgi:hypothetical protein
MAPAVEHLPSKHKPLSLNPRTARQRQRKTERERKRERERNTVRR